MGFILRKESIDLSSSLESFEEDKQAAARQGAAALEQFEGKALSQTLQTPDPQNSGGSSSDTSSTDSSSDSGSDSGSDSSGGSDDFGMDNLDDPFSSENSEDDDSDKEEGEEGEEEENDEDEDKEKEDGDDENEDENDAEVKTERFREIVGIPSDFQFRLESTVLEGFTGAAMQAWGAFSFVVGALASAGINYGPQALSGLFKVVLYTFARTFELLTAFGEACSERIERYQNSHTKQMERLSAVAKMLKEKMDQNAEIPPEQKAEFQVVALMGGGEGGKSATMAQVIKYQAEFTTKCYGQLLKGAKEEFRQLNELAHLRYLGRHFDAMAYLNDDASFKGFQKLTGVRMMAPEGTEYYTLGIMPAGGFLCIANLPQQADNWNQIEKNYNAAGFQLSGLGVSREFQAMTPNELLALLQSVKVLIDSSTKNQVFYEELANARSGVITQIRSLFVQLVRSQTRVSFKDSTALPLFLKSSIATKVYLVGAMDLQDHNARVVANALAFAEWNIKLLRGSSKEAVPSTLD